MAYTNFIPEFWNEKILRDNAKLTVLAKLANKEYEGDIAKMGDTVHILGLGGVTVNTYSGSSINFETVTDESVALVVDQAKYFACKVDDVDKRQAVPDTMSAILAEATEALAEDHDTYLGTMLMNATLDTTDITPAAALTTDTAWSTIHKAITALRKNGVKTTTKTCAVVTPEYFERLLRKKEAFDYQKNGDIQNEGWEGKINGCEIYVSNNLPQNGSSKDVCYVFTKNRAFADAEQITDTEACRPSNLFADVIKGLHLYGAKVVRPKEIVRIVLTNGYDS